MTLKLALTPAKEPDIGIHKTFKLFSLERSVSFSFPIMKYVAEIKSFLRTCGNLVSNLI